MTLKTAYLWFRRTHDVLAIMLCCLWVVGWFVEVEILLPEPGWLSVSSIRADAGEVRILSEVFFVTDRSEFQCRPWGKHQRRVLDFNASIFPRLLNGESLVSHEKAIFGQSALMAADTRIPSILIVWVFLIWPLGRLTHRIARRPEKIPNVA